MSRIFVTIFILYIGIFSIVLAACPTTFKEISFSPQDTGKGLTFASGEKVVLPVISGNLDIIYTFDEVLDQECVDSYTSDIQIFNQIWDGGKKEPLAISVGATEITFRRLHLDEVKENTEAKITLGGREIVTRVEIDETPPEFTIHTDIPRITNLNEVPLKFTIKDDHKIGKITTSPSGIEQIVADNHGSSQKVIDFNLDLSQETGEYKLIVKAEDGVGNEKEKRFTTTFIDKDFPNLKKIDGKEVEVTPSHDGKNHKVTIKITLQDESYKSKYDDTLGGDLGDIYIDASSIENGKDNEKMNCVDTITNNERKCEIEPTINAIESSQDVEVTFKLRDRLGNEWELKKTINIDFDTEPPQITAEIINGVGQKNIISENDRGDIKLHLTINERDEIERLERPHFSGSFKSAIGECNVDSSLENTITCDIDKGKLGNEGENKLGVEIEDLSKNKNKKVEIQIIVDNTKPTIEEVEHDESANIPGSEDIYVIGETLEFKVRIKEKNELFSVFGDFSGISDKDNDENGHGSKKEEGNCNERDKDVHTCTFSIELTKGVEKGEIGIEFTLEDKAGNKRVETESIPIEVLELTDCDTCVEPSFNIEDNTKKSECDDEYVRKGGGNKITSMCPISRNSISGESADTTPAWFKGKVVLKDNSNKDFEPLYIKLESCEGAERGSVGSLGALSISKASVYPDETYRFENNKREFTFFMEISSHENLADLTSEELRTKCIFLVKKKQGLKVFEKEEEIAVDIYVTFYSSPYKDLNEAHANKILDEIEKLRFQNGKYNFLFRTVETTRNLCLAGNAALTAVSGTNTALIVSGTIIEKIPPISGVGKFIKEAAKILYTGVQKPLSKFFGEEADGYADGWVFRKSCDVILCGYKEESQFQERGENIVDNHREELEKTVTSVGELPSTEVFFDSETGQSWKIMKYSDGREVKDIYNDEGDTMTKSMTKREIRIDGVLRNEQFFFPNRVETQNYDSKGRPIANVNPLVGGFGDDRQQLSIPDLIRPPTEESEIWDVRPPTEEEKNKASV